MSNIMLNPTDTKYLKDAIIEISNGLTRIDAERDNIKEIVEAVSKKLGIKKNILNKVAKAHHKHEYDKLQMENEHFEYVYESLLGTNEG